MDVHKLFFPLLCFVLLPQMTSNSSIPLTAHLLSVCSYSLLSNTPLNLKNKKPPTLVSRLINSVLWAPMHRRSLYVFQCFGDGSPTWWNSWWCHLSSDVFIIRINRIIASWTVRGIWESHYRSNGKGWSKNVFLEYIFLSYQ